MKNTFTLKNVLKFLCVLSVVILLTNSSNAQAPVITYTSPSAYIAGTAITLSPNTGGGAVPATIYGTVTTFAGSAGTTGKSNLTGTAATFNYPSGLSIDNSGNIFIADYSNNEIRKITTAAVVSLFAGSSAGTAGSTNLPALFSGPNDISTDPATGNMYVADFTNNKIRMITPAGVVTVLAGSGAPGRINSPTGASATFNGPYGVAFDATTGNVYVADNTNNEIRKITSAGAVTLFAGSTSGFTGRTNASGSLALFSGPVSVAVDASGNVYVADQANNEIRKITPAGAVSLFAGNVSGTSGSADGTGSAAFFNQPNGLTFDAAGNLYVTELGNNSIRKITPAGVVSTFAGTGSAGLINGVGTAAAFSGPEGLDIDPVSGNLFVADNSNQVIRKIITSGYTISGTLPAGLSFDGTTGIISGTPTTPTAATTYTIIAYNKSGSSSATVTLSVLAGPLADYGFSKPIVLNTSQISNGGISSTLTDFPALVYIKDDALKILNNCGDKVQFPLGNGGGLTGGTNYDFAFTLSGSTTELSYQVDTYDSINGILFCWVRIPSLTSTNLPLTFYFGSQNPAHSAAFSATTWASDYKAVYHFNEASTSAPVLDATSSARNAVQANTTVTNDEIHIAANVPIPGGGYSFNGTSSSIIQNTGTNPDITDMFTLSAWVYYNGPSTSDNKIISNEINYTQGYKLSVKGGKLETETRYVGGDGVGNLGTGGAVSSQTWHYIQGVFTGGATNGTFINYVDGVAVPIASMTFRKQRTDIRPNAGDVAQMGIDYLKKTTDPNDNTRATNWYNGYMDEVRISNMVKSPDWIRAEYYNQTKPLLFTDFSGAVLSYKNNAPLLVGALVYTWTGLSSTAPTDQAQQDNWDAGAVPVFNGNTKMNIPVVGSGKYPVLTADAGIYSLTIASGASLNLNGHTLSVGCNIYNNTTTGGTGILNAGNSTSGVNWNGSLAAQYYYGANTKNTAEIGKMTVNNSSTGTITVTGGPVDIYNTLTLTKGNLVIDNTGNGDLTLKSTALLTASVETIPSAYSITGLVNAERYITGGAFKYRGYRFLSSPVYTAKSGSNYYFDLSYLSLYAPITGTLGVSGGMSKTGNPTIYLYRGDTFFTNASFNGGNFRGVNKINNSPLYTVGVDFDGNFNLYVGNGFWFFYRGDLTNISTKYLVSTTPESNVFVSRGTLNQQTVTFKHWYTNASTLQYSVIAGNALTYVGYNMVGNPYASSLDWDTFSATDPNAGIYGPQVNKTIYLYNETMKTYGTYDGTFALNGASHIIPSGQGFYVQAKDATAQLIFHEGGKTSAQVTGSNLLLSKKPVKSTPVLQYIRLALSKDSDNMEEAVVRFESSAKDEFVVDEDSKHMAGSGGVNFSSFTSDNITVSINDIPLPKKNQTTIRLYVSATADGQYTFNKTELKNVPDLYEIWLKDAYKKDSLDIKHNSAYIFNILRSDTNSYGANRFSLVIRQNAALGLHLLNFTASKTSKGAELVWKTENELNLTNFTIERSTDNGKTFDVVGGFVSSSEGTYSLLDKKPPVATDLYRLKLEDLNGTITYSNIIALRYSTLSDNTDNSAVNIYPNPASSIINIAIVKNSIDVTQTVKPSYSIKITNSTGKILKTINTTQDTWQENVGGLLPGAYVVDITSNIDNTMVGKAKFVKL